MFKKTKSESKKTYLFKNISEIDRYSFYEYLSNMLDSWVSIKDALLSISDRIENGYFRSRIDELITFVISWDSFSKSVKRLPDVFNPMEISIIETWEKKGKLSAALERLAKNSEATYKLKTKIRDTFSSPILLFISVIIAFLLVITYVIPNIIPLFDASEIGFSLWTNILIWTSRFFSENMMYFLWFAVVLLIIFFWYKSSEKWETDIAHMMLELPILWNIHRNYILASIALDLSDLTDVWVNLEEAFELMGKTTENIVYKSILYDISTEISIWNEISKSIDTMDEENKYFPSDFLHMLSVWEKNKTLPKVCKKISQQYTSEIDHCLLKFSKKVEPMIVAVIALLVLWFGFSVFSAILKVTQSVL